MQSHITLDDQTRAFLSLLWRGGAFAYFWTADESITYTNEQGDQELVKRSFWFPVGKVPQPPQKPTAHVYFSVNPSTEKRSGVQRALMASVASLGCLFVEWDVADWNSKEAILDFVATLPRQPSVLIDSGGGYHAYWLLETPYIIDSDEARQHAKDVSRRWVRFCEGDDVKDLTRVLRLPGSRNIKPKYAPDYPLVEYVYCDLDRRYALADLVSILPDDRNDETIQNAPRRDVQARSALNGQGSIIDVYNAEVTVESRLEAAGYLPRGKRYCRPGADKSTNSSVVILDDNCSYHWDTGDELADEHKHSAFDVYCHFEHAGNAKAAVKAFMHETGKILEVEMLAGVACCPIHHTPLPRAANGNGFKCHQKDGSEWCSFYWKGTDMPNSHIPTIPTESRSSLSLTREDVVMAKAATDRGRFSPHSRFDLDSIQEPDWLLDGEIVARAYNLIYGPSGSGKTFYLVDILRRASAIGFVVYIATEDTAGLKVRIMAQEKAHGVNLDNFGWIDEPIDLANRNDVDDLIRDLSALAPVLVIIDTLAMAHSGDENSNQDMSVVNRAARKIIAETGAAVAVVHHTGVNEGRERGATSLMGNVDLKVKVTMDDDIVVISQEKVRNGKPADPRKFRLTTVSLSLIDKHGKPVESAVIRPAADVTMRGAALTTQQKALLEALALEVFAVAGAKGSQLMANVPNLASSSFYRTISTLIKKGMVWQNKKGDPFYITDKGRDEMAPEYLEAPDQGYTPQGYDSDTPQGYTSDKSAGDSQNEIQQQSDQLSHSHAIPTDSQSSLESESNHLPNLSSLSPTHYSVGERESWERDRKEETELFPDDTTPAPASSIHVPTEAERNAPASEFDFVPPNKRTVLRVYLRSGKDIDQQRARELCDEYEIDYATALAEVRAQSI